MSRTVTDIPTDPEARFRLRSPGAPIPSGVDAEAAQLLWPLLGSGASREVLVGRMAVEGGLDTATASARVQQVLVPLLSSGLLI